MQLTIPKKMAACTFYQNALRASKVNDWINMTRNHLRLMIRNFSTTKKLTPFLMPVFQKMSICFFKQFPTAVHSGKMYIRHLFRYGQFLINIKTLFLFCRIVFHVAHHWPRSRKRRQGTETSLSKYRVYLIFKTVECDIT